MSPPAERELWMVRPPAPAVVAELPGEADDAALVDRANRGDRWAKEALYRRHVRYVAGIVIRLIANRADAEDVVQDTFVAAFSELGRLRDPGAVRGWIARIAVHQAHRRFRRRRLLAKLGFVDRREDDAPLESIAAPGVTAEARADLAALDRVLERLGGKERFAWMLRHVEGWDLAEVARGCGCSLATAKRRIAAADRRVRDHVREAAHD